jgi:site-specific recombinase XerD
MGLADQEFHIIVAVHRDFLGEFCDLRGASDGQEGVGPGGVGAVGGVRGGVRVLRAWLKERRGQPDEPLFPTRQGRPLSRYSVGAIVTRHVTTAAANCPLLMAKRTTPHTLRHTNAMLLRTKGVDIATIALWLGHETTQTTHIYEHADPALKERAIARTAPLGAKPGRYRPSDELLAFLEGL